MKKQIAVLLAATLIVGLTACSGNVETSTTVSTAQCTVTAFDSATTTATSSETTDTESKGTVSAKPTASAAPISKPSRTKVPTVPTDSNHQHNYEYRTERDDSYCTEAGYVYHYCSCGKYQTWSRLAGSHSLSRITVKEATRKQDGLDKIICGLCPYSTTEVIPKITSPYLTDIELVSCQRPNSHYLSDGTQLLDKIYGKYQAAQVGDTYIYRIVMSDGGTNGFTVESGQTSNVDMTVNGNLVTVTVKSMSATNVCTLFSVESSDINNKPIYREVSTRIMLGNVKFTALSREGVHATLRDYIRNKGMESYLTLLNQFSDGTLTSYTGGDPAKSLSGTSKYGHDDYIEVAAHADWLDRYFDLIDQYEARGFTKVYMYYTGKAVELRAC